MYRESQIVSCDCEKFYEVVADVGRYPDFLPGWDEVEVNEQADGTLQVEQHVKFGPINEHLRSVARFEPPNKILVEPDSRQKAAGVALEWHFAPIDSGRCRVDLRIEGRARNALVRRLLGGVIHQMAKDMIHRFTQRVDALYDEPCRIIR